MLQYTHTDVNSEKPVRLIPAPFVAISREQHREGSGEIVGYTYIITLTGRILPYKGNPSPAGAWETSESWISTEHSGDDPLTDMSADTGFSTPKHMEALLKKEKAIREAFSFDGGLLEIISPGSAPGLDNTIKCRPRVTSVEFAGGQYVGANDYTITLEADFIYGLGDASTARNSTPGIKFNIKTASEDWSIEEDDEFFWLSDTLEMTSGERTAAYRITRNISATGQAVFSTKVAGSAYDDTPHHKDDDGDDEAGPFDTSVGGAAWQQARGYVLDMANNSSADSFFQRGGRLVGQEYESGAMQDDDNDYYKLSHLRKHKPDHKLEKTNGATLDAEGNPPFNPLDAGGVFQPDGNLFQDTIQGVDDDGAAVTLQNWRIYNYVRTQNVDEKGGTFSIAENFIILNAGSVYSSPFTRGAPAIETIDISVDEGVETGQEITVNMNGTIRGLDTGRYQTRTGDTSAAGSDAFDNAVAYFNYINDNTKMRTRVQNLSGIDEDVYGKLNLVPVSKNITKSPKDGSVTYSFSYNNRIDPCLSGAISETIDVNDTMPGMIVAITPTIGRFKGPVLQYLGARTENKRSLSINAVFNVDLTRTYHTVIGTDIPILDDDGEKIDITTQVFCSGLRPPAANLTAARALAQEVRPVEYDTDPASPTFEEKLLTIFDLGESQSWNPRNGSYTYNIEWVYEDKELGDPC